MFTEENARANQALSAQARKQNNEGKKAFKEFFNNLLDEKGGTLNGRQATKKELVTARAIRILLDENTADKDFLKAFEIIRDTIGEKPVEKQEITVNDDSVREMDEYFARHSKRTD